MSRVLCIMMAVVVLLCTAVPAHAQIAFRNFAQASAASGGGGGGGISFVAGGNQIAGTGATITPVIPAGSAANDFAILLVAGRPTDTAEPTAPAGWTFRSSSLRSVGANDLKIMTFYRILVGGDANPTLNLPASWQGGGGGMSGQIAVWRGVDATTPFDVADVTGNSPAARDWQPPSITTVTNNAWVVSAVATSDDNRLRFRRANGFTGRMLDVNYDTTVGGDHSIGLADNVKPTAGAPNITMPEWGETRNRNDPWAGITFALRPGPAPLANLVIAVPGTTAVGDVMVASIGVRPCSSVNGGACTVTILPAQAGWTQVGATVNQTGGGGTGGFGNRLAVYWRVATAADVVVGASYGWNFSGAPVHGGAVGGITSYSGVDTASPIVAFGSQATPNAFTHTAPSINTGTVTNTMLVSTHADNSSATWIPSGGTTPPGLMTEAVDIPSLTAPNALGISIEVNYQLFAGPGATGTRTATQNNNAASDTGTTHMLALRPAVTVNHYAISVLSTTVANCDFAEVTITAHNAAHAAVNPPSSRTVTLSVSVGAATAVWQSPAVAGSGTWTPAGATATYLWPGSEPSFTVRLRQSAVVSLTVNANDTFVSEDATEDPTISFVNSAFRISTGANAALAIGNQIAAKPSNTGVGTQSLFLQAIRTDTVTGACTSVFPNPSEVDIQVGAQCNNPATCTQNVTLTTTSGSGSPTGNFVPAGVGTYPATIRFRFTTANSEAPFFFSYADAGQITLQFQHITAAPAVTIAGTSNAFVTRPFGFAFRGANVATAMQHGTLPTSALLAAAGDNFTMTLAAYRWVGSEDDGTGNPLPGANITDNGLTPNFASSTTVSATGNLPGVATGAVARGVGCAGAATIVAASWLGGAATIGDWCYDEVGNAFLGAAAVDYIVAGVNVAGNSGLDGTGVAGGFVGRFSPKRFELDTAPAPARVNRQALACAPVSTFSYLDEGLELSFRLLARNTQGGQTLNYTSAYARHDPTAGGTNDAKTAYDIGARNVAPFAPLTGRVTGAYVTGPPTWSNGVLNVTGANATLVSIARPTPDDPPDGPYAQVQFGIAPTDPDGVLMVAPYDLDVDNSGGPDHTATAPTTEVRYGRLRLGAASGSQLLSLGVPMEAQYWNGTFYVTNVDDNCTILATTDVGLGNYIGNLNAGETTVTAVTSPLVAGRGTITLSAPGNGNNGSVDLAVNLGSTGLAAACPTFTPVATAADKAYLRGKWCGTTHTKDPSTRARFGIQRGSDETIYLRENY